MIGRPGNKAKKAAKFGVKAHKKAAKFGVKAHKKAAKFGYKAHKAAAKFGAKHAGTIASGGMNILAKKLFGKKNTNVSKAGKEKRRERIDKREGAPSEKVQARRDKIDAADAKRFGKNEAARTRINKKITKMNERKGTNYKTYEKADTVAGGKRGKGRNSNVDPNTGPRAQAQAAKAKAAKKDARTAKRDANKQAVRDKLSKLRSIFANRKK